MGKYARLPSKTAIRERPAGPIFFLFSVRKSMTESFPDIMTIEETSRYLRIPLSSLYRLAQAGKVPGQKVGRNWRFRRQALEHWLGESNKTRTMNDREESHVDSHPG
jgi:excisionase family DNA binding protein